MTRVPQPYIARGRRLVLKIAVAAMLAVHAFVRSARTIRAPTSIHQRSSDEMANSIGSMKIAKKLGSTPVEKYMITL